MELGRERAACFWRGEGQLERVGLLNEATHEHYVGLLCRFAPHDVLEYLQAHDTYRVDVCLALCEEHHIKDATAYLLERTGNMGGALALLLEALDVTLHTLASAIFLFVVPYQAAFERVWAAQVARRAYFSAAPDLNPSHVQSGAVRASTTNAVRWRPICSLANEANAEFATCF